MTFSTHYTMTHCGNPECGNNQAPSVTPIGYQHPMRVNRMPERAMPYRRWCDCPPDLKNASKGRTGDGC